MIFSGAFPVAEHSLSDAFNSLTKFFGKKEDETSIKQRTLALVKRQQEHEVREAMREGAVIDMDNQFRHNLAGVFTFESSSDEESDDALFRRHYDERHNQNKSQLRFGSTHDDETDDDVADTLLFDPTGTHEENLGPFRKDDVDDTFTPVAQRESNDQGNCNYALTVPTFATTMLVFFVRKKSKQVAKTALEKCAQRR